MCTYLTCAFKNDVIEGRMQNVLILRLKRRFWSYDVILGVEQLDLDINMLHSQISNNGIHLEENNPQFLSQSASKNVKFDVITSQ